MPTEFDDSRDYAFFLRDSTTLRNGGGFANRWSEQVLASLRAAGILDNMVDGETPPADLTKLWLDKNFDPAILKTWSAAGSNWRPVTFTDFFGQYDPLNTVKLNRDADGITDTYTLDTAGPTVPNGHIYVHAYVGRVLQEKDGTTYTIINNGTQIRYSEIPPAGERLYVEGVANFYEAVSAAAASLIPNDSALPGDYVADAIEILNQKLSVSPEDFMTPSMRLAYLTSHYTVGSGTDLPDATAAVRSAVKYAEEHRIDVLLQRVYRVTEEIEVKQPLNIKGIGPGGGYSDNILLDYKPRSGFVVTGTIAKRIRTRRLFRASAGDPQDAPLSCVINVQAENCHFDDFVVFKDFDPTNMSPTNFGGLCDIGVFVGCRVHFSMSRVHILGYFEEGGLWNDVTHSANLPRFPDLDGNPYDDTFDISGGDGLTLEKCLIRGPRWAIRTMGALPKVGQTTYSDPYYDQILGTTVTDNRGVFGFSDTTAVACSFYGTDHHSNWRRADPTGNFVTDTVSGGVMWIDGLAGNASGILQGMRFLSCRFSSFEPYRVRLGRVNRAQFIGCHMEARNSSSRKSATGATLAFDATDCYGMISRQAETTNTLVIGALGSLGSTGGTAAVDAAALASTHEFFNAASTNNSKTFHDIDFRGKLAAVDTVLELVAGDTRDVVMYSGTTELGRFGQSAIRPGTDNAMTAGTASLRYSTVYAATGTINTSDETTKQQIGPIPDAWLDAWGDVEWGRFKFNDAVAEKGDAARWHVGLIAQRVRDVFADRSIDAFQIGLLCWDEWDEVREDVEEEIDEIGRDGIATGEKIMVKSGETRVVLAAGSRFSLRYEEALAMEAAYQRRWMASVSARLASIEGGEA